MSPGQEHPYDHGNVFEDLSGVRSSAYDNPYDGLIEAAQGDPVSIQSCYATHRTIRNKQQRVKLLDQAFPGITLDQTLRRLRDPETEPGYIDSRHCLVFWARPPPKIKDLVGEIQQMLLTVAPNIWVMPSDCLHMTVLEITHSRTAEEISTLVERIGPKIQEITDYTLQHRARLVKPMLSYDGAAVALSFLPAAGEERSNGPTELDDLYTYHHLRRDLYALSESAGVVVDSRYVVPSAHITIGRFVTYADHSTNGMDGNQVPDPKKMRAWLAKIEEINIWLEQQYWPKGNQGVISPGGQWIVGEGKGLDCRMGTLWYGGGVTVRLGQGF